ncbi:hypothetical protein [Dactylosporangium siamense]|uniref:hypothetical protein n=1 Tax=Dactylosporangium siamense TaxID=685454 RepID=UPI0031E8373F
MPATVSVAVCAAMSWVAAGWMRPGEIGVTTTRVATGRCVLAVMLGVVSLAVAVVMGRRCPVVLF